MAKKKIYLVEHRPGEYREFTNWPECQSFVSGKPFAFAGGATRAEALRKLKAGKAKRAAAAGKPQRKTKSSKPAAQPADYPTEGITADAGTHGNPGPCEYQVTDLEGKVLAHRDLGIHTNNYAELAGIGGMITIAVSRGETVLWTDSKIALGWIKSGKLGPTVHERDQILAMIRSIQELLQQHPQLELRKWNTRAWGQIPSDFGRK